jgi:carboxyl-terminal processing protease
MIRKVTLLVLGLLLGASGTIVATQPGFIGAPANAANSDTYRQLNLFGDIFERIRSDYVDIPDDSELIEAAINGMLGALDPYSSYLDAKEHRDLQVQTRGEFGGLGIEVTMEDGLVKVVAPIDDTPAAKAGILAGDLITHLDDEPVSGLTLAEAVERMRGRVNTPITLRITRGEAAEPIEITVVRDTIRIRAVRWRSEDDVGYIRITQFSEQTFENLRQAIETLENQIPANELKGFVIDMRNNPGGRFDQAIAVSDAFLDRGEIVSTRGRNAEESQRYNARSGDLLHGKPIVVLINGGSASASEIVAGALRDHRRATVVGSKSFGKGTVQTIIPVGSSGALRLTTARYYTPSGTSIHETGIEPDISIEQELPEELRSELEEDFDDDGAMLDEADGNQRSPAEVYVPQDAEEDRQLTYALNLLRGIEINSAFPPDSSTSGAGVPN